MLVAGLLNKQNYLFLLSCFGFAGKSNGAEQVSFASLRFGVDGFRPPDVSPSFHLVRPPALPVSGRKQHTTYFLAYGPLKGNERGEEERKSLTVFNQWNVKHALLIFFFFFGCWVRKGDTHITKGVSERAENKWACRTLVSCVLFSIAASDVSPYIRFRPPPFIIFPPGRPTF